MEWIKATSDNIPDTKSQIIFKYGPTDSAAGFEVAVRSVWFIKYVLSLGYEVSFLDETPDLTKARLRSRAIAFHNFISEVLNKDKEIVVSKNFMGIPKGHYSPSQMHNFFIKNKANE